MRERHIRRPQRPIAYAVLLVAAFLIAAFATVAVWREEAPAPVAASR